MYKTFKKNIIILFCIFVFLFLGVYSFAQMETIDQEHLKTINQDIYRAIGSEDIDEDNNILRQGAYLPVDDDKVRNAIVAADGEPILQYDEGSYKTLKYIKNIVNYILGFLGFIALIYLIYHGFIVVTSTDENKHEEAMKAIKTASIAIAGIGVAWFLVTFIYYVIGLITY